MPRFNDIVHNFTGGEQSPRLYGRTDFDSYKRSCRNLKNMIVYPQGGTSFRGGSQLVLEDLFNPIDYDFSLSSSARIIPFVVSETESYFIIFSADTIASGGFAGYNYAYSLNLRTGAVGFFQHQGNFSFLPSGATSTVYTDGSKLEKVQYVQSGDVLLLTHPECIPQRIIRLAENTFGWYDYSTPPTSPISTFSFMPFMDQNTDTSHLIDASATTGLITLTSSTSFFNAGHVGSLFAFQDSGTIGIAAVSAYTSPTLVNATVLRTLPAAATAGSGTAQWYEGAWSTYRGFPSSVALWNNRALFGGTVAQPDTIYASQLFDIFEMSNIAVLDPGTALTESDPQSFTIASDRVNDITWMTPGKSDLLVGTRGREYAVKDFTTTSVQINPQTGYGSEYIQPVVVDDVPVFVQRGFRKLREILFDDRTAGYLSPEVTFFAEHITRKSQSIYPDAVTPKIKQMAYQAMDNNLLWVIDNNGYLYSATKTRETPTITAFHRHELGGAYSTSIPKVLSIAVAPSADGTTDELYMLVKRTVNSADKITLEKFSYSFYEDTLHEDVDDRRRIPVFLDAAKIFRTHVGANFYARLYSGPNANESDGSATGTVTGSISYTYKRAELSNTDYISWDGTGNADFAQAGCIRATLWLSEYGNQGLFCVSKANADADNLIALDIVSGNLVLTINDATGSPIINAVSLGSLSGAYYLNSPLHFELNYDITNGATRLFINGKQFGSTQTATGTRDTSIDLIRVGADYAGSNSVQRGFAADIIIFNSVQHTSDFEYYEYQKKGTSVTRLEYLEGQTVGVLGDGNDLGTFVVSSGAITLGDSYDTLVVGLVYDFLLEIQSIEAGSGIGSAQGRPTRVDTLALRFNASAQCKFGRDADTQEEINFRSPSDPVDEPIALYTGDYVLPFAGDYTVDSRIVLTGSSPLPCNVTCIVMRGVTND